MELRLAVLGSTKGTDLEGIVDAIHNKVLNASIEIVISNKKGAHILERARKHNLKTFHINYLDHSSREDAEKEIVAKLKEHRVELVLLIGWMKILTSVLVDNFRGRIWNVHPSLLPKYGGGMNLDVHKAVLVNKETETGCTIHQVTEEVDAGKILCQKKLDIAPEDTPESLKDKVQVLEQQAFVETLLRVTNGELSIGV